MERTLVIIKPDAVQRGLIGDITARLERRGLKLAVSQDLAHKHYGIHEGKPFFEGLIRYITSAPVVVMVWQGPGAIGVVRRTMGATNPQEAAPGTLRADYGLDIERNLIHGSDGPETAETEINLYFEPGELVDWERSSDPWITR
jgi:nucleoside-diphosphate kinase